MKNQLPSNSRKKQSDSEDSSDKFAFARYTNIIYQLIGVIAIAFGAGYLLDRTFNLSFPVFKLIFSFGGVILALYLVFKELSKK